MGQALHRAVASMGLALGLSAAQAGPILFNVTFETTAADSYSVGAVPLLGTAPAGGVSTRITSRSLGTNPPAGTDILVQNQSWVQDGESSAAFPGFGSGNFLIFRDTGANLPSITNLLHANDQLNQGTLNVKYDMQIHKADATSPGNQSFIATLGLNARVANTFSLSTLSVSLNPNDLGRGSITVAANNGTAILAYGIVASQKMLLDTAYTVEAKVTLGATSSVTWLVNGTPLATSTGQTVFPLASTATMGTTKLTNVQFNSSDAARGIIALDNIAISIPEPTGIGVAGLGGLAMLRRWR